MDKGKIMNELQQKMSKHYCNVEVLEYLDCLALKVGDKIIAHFRDWDADHYYMECGPDLTEWALSNSILLEFYEAGRKLLKKTIKKYAVKVLKGNAAEEGCNYLNVNFRENIVSFGTNFTFDDFKSSFTKSEIEELKKRDDIAIDWDKVELEEVK